MDENHEPTRCPLCDNINLDQISVNANRSLRSDGIIINAILRKRHCCCCGLGWSDYNPNISIPYHRSSGTSAFEIARCQNLAVELRSILRRFVSILPNKFSVLEVGAGSFYTSEYLARLIPKSNIVALEISPERDPEEVNVLNLECKKQLLSDHAGQHYSIIFSNMVLEHQSDPYAFFEDCLRMLSDDGLIITIVPNGAIAHSELLFIDHLFHFTSTAFDRLAKSLGVHIVHYGPTPWDNLCSFAVFAKKPLLEDNQSLLPSAYYIKSKPLRSLEIQSLLEERTNMACRWSYVEEDEILNDWDDAKKYYIFGAGEYSQLIQCYMPALFSRVEACVVSDLTGSRLIDKPILSIDAIIDKLGSRIILGTKAASRGRVRQMLLENGFSCHNIIEFKYI